MSVTISPIRSIGVTTAVSVGATASTPVQIIASSNDQNNFVSLLNTGANAVAVKFGQTNSVTPVLPVAGTPGDYVLPAAMNAPILFAVPTTPCYVSLIGAAAGPALVYVTPVTI